MRRQQSTDQLNRSDDDIVTVTLHDDVKPIAPSRLQLRKSVKEMIQAIEDKVQQNRQRQARRVQTKNQTRTVSNALNESSHRPKKKMRVLPIDLKDRPRLIFLLPHQLSQSSSSIQST